MSTTDNVIPFIFARATEESQDNYRENGGELVIRDWIVKVAIPDFVLYSSIWMDDPELGSFCLAPDVDYTVEDVKTFPTFEAARTWVGEWWVMQMARQAGEEHNRLARKV